MTLPPEVPLLWASSHHQETTRRATPEQQVTPHGRLDGDCSRSDEGGAMAKRARKKKAARKNNANHGKRPLRGK
ncbi:hypothetical protein FHX42_002421 [Saccharopolyspora lacisalsi]|uniref:Uncharacterized protein n=1 Tax=Halosaccharopolyspora lacisalsi TaxID=1000566 RepID=A0A839DVZ5_9PSEU|nr:hypothetical protein [Halosaccharopolyspora lacisalsi]MBA8825070.1 hypothetical protein [Halosaccharopolyspora lacisalsi]